MKGSQHLQITAVIFGASMLLFGCHSRGPYEEHLKVWYSAEASAEEKYRAALAIVTNGMPRGEVVRLLGEPHYEIHRYGINGGTSNVLLNASNAVGAQMRSCTRFDVEDLLYCASDGRACADSV